MNSKYVLFFFLGILILIASCSKEDTILQEAKVVDEELLSDYQLDVIDYFKDIALGFEFGNASSITRKWRTEMNVFIGGDPSSELLAEFEKIRNEINELATDGFRMTVVDDSLQSNYYIFLGTGNEYAQMFPYASNLVDSNWGLFFVFWNGQNQLTSGHMYVDIMRADSVAQKHLLREELTQSLGLAKDSPLYMQSIFQSAWTTTTEYAPIDKDLIRLLYHPAVGVGLGSAQVENVLKRILINE